MTRAAQFWLLAAFVALAGLVMAVPWQGAPLRAAEPAPLVTGSVFDRQGQPVTGAQVTIEAGGGSPLSQAVTQPDGRYALPVPEVTSDRLTLHIERAHFQAASLELNAAVIQNLQTGQTVVLPDTTLIRRISLAFWISAGVFVAVLALIAAGRLHNTLSALVGVRLIFAVSYLGRPLSENLFIFDFRGALGYVDWNVIFLIMGMMIVIAVVERTGIFQWLAFWAYRLSGGRTWLLVAILMILTGVASALLDNVTTMLPVIGYLTVTVPGAQTKVLFYCLSVGSAMGGNGSLIGASANMVTAGISERSGQPITYAYFFKKGFPAMLHTVGLATLWLLLRFLVLGGSNG